MDHLACRLADLVDQHYVLLYRYAYRLSGSSADAEDLTQQAFLIAQTKWDQLRDETRAKSWLFTIIRNAYLKQLRAEACLPAQSLDDVAEPAENIDADDIDHEQLQNVLNDLPEEYRSPIILFYFEEFSYREIADHMGVPLGTVMSRLARGKAYLRTHLTAREPGATSTLAAH